MGPARAVLAAWLAAAAAACAQPRGNGTGIPEPPAAFTLDEAPAGTVQELAGLVRLERWEAAADLIGSLGAAPWFRPDPDRESWVNVWDAVHDRLGSPPDGLVSELRRRGAGAAEAFDAAFRSDEWPVCSSLVDRHLHAEGFRARADRLAAAAVERGAWHSGIRLGRRLLALRPPAEWDALTVGRTAFACARTGRLDTLRALAVRLNSEGDPDRWVRLGEEDLLLGEVLSRLEQEAANFAGDESARDAAGAPEVERFGRILRILVEPSGSGRRYSLEAATPSGVRLWIVALGVIESRSATPRPWIWLRSDLVRVQIEGRLVVSVEALTGRPLWARSVDDLLR